MEINQKDGTIKSDNNKSVSSFISFEKIKCGQSNDTLLLNN